MVYIALTKAQKELNRLKKEEFRRRVEQRAVPKAATGQRRVRALRDPAIPALEDQTAPQINESIQNQVGVVLGIAQNSKNLGSVFQTAIKEAAVSIAENSARLAGLCDSEECRRLRHEHAELKAREAKRASEIEELRKELSEMKATLQNIQIGEGMLIPRSETAAELPVPITKDDLEQAVQSMKLDWQERFNACMVAVTTEHAHLPPESPGMAAPAVQVVAGSLVQTTESPEANAPAPASKRRKTRKKKRSLAVQAAVAARTEPVLSPAAPIVVETWAEVASRGVTRQTVKTPAKRRVPVNLTVPKSAAIVLTLRPESAGSDLNYLDLVTLARSKIDLASMNVEYLKFKETATGARIIEIPGPNKEAKADQLAEKLKQTFSDVVGEEMVEVTRPIKCAELLITGLDDTASREDVAAMVAAKGGCTEAHVRVGEVCRTPYGVRLVWVRCPVAAAKRRNDT